ADGWSAPADIKRFMAYEIPHDVYAVARSIQLIKEPVDHWGDVDSDASVWVAGNLPVKNREGKPPLRHTLGPQKNFDVDWDTEEEMLWDPSEVVWHGSSALFAVLCCIAMGYTKIVLAGAPLDGKGHWYDPHIKGPRWTCETYQAWFEFAACEQANMVKSLSGYTAQLLGEPVEEWLYERLAAN
ncbi:hypothetical protein KAR91_83660, partial [Candidatus Pacearchaeota archaeon]|nr:hypothetical protein [Candidatus Pacearchaeota archaeon]